jgi:RNA polymerase sigma factor (sigma-70 family)
MGRCRACDAGIDSWDSAQRGGYPDTSNFSACSGFSEAEPGSRPTLEASALTHAGVAGHARSPLLRLQSDERLITLIRRGNHHAFEALVARYQARLLAFCRHMLSSREDAEDVLQEVFAAAFNAINADEREINVRPWLYRIARNRSLNHLRKAQAIGVDSMDVHLSEHGLTTADKVHKREEFRQLMADVQDLPETQRTALLLREIDALSYEQIAEAMETTVPSVKSLLVRARVGLAEAAEARLLTCEEVRDELGEVAEGLRRTSPPVRRHLRTCDRCQLFKRQLRQTNRALAAVFPVGPLLLLKKVLLAHAGGAAASSGGAAAAGGGAAAGAAAGGAMSAGAGALASKAVAGLAAAAIVTAGAVEVKHVKDRPVTKADAAQTAQAAPPVAVAERAEPVAVASAPQPVTEAPAPAPAKSKTAEKPAAKPRAEASATPAPAPAAVQPAVTPVPSATPTPAAGTPPNVEQHEGDTVTLPDAPADDGAPTSTGSGPQLPATPTAVPTPPAAVAPVPTDPPAVTPPGVTPVPTPVP